MSIPIFRHRSRSANTRLFRKRLPKGLGFIPLCVLLFNLLWMGCECGDVTPTYKVTFNTNGGTAIDPQPVKQGAVVNKPADPTKAGFVFAGWYSDAALTQVYDFKAKATKDITLYAKWSPIYTVTFDSNEGTPVASRKVPEGSAFSKPADPTRTGYVFDGWYSDAALTQVYDFAAKVTKNITLYAKWARPYMVTFNSNGGTAVASQNVPEGGTVTKPTDPTRQGYSFAGWYSDEALTQVYDFAAKVTKSITLYAKWAPIYTVMFNTNGGTPVTPRNVPEGATFPKPADPTRKDYLFAGWYSDVALTQVYDFAAAVTKNITLYAKWTRTYTVVFASRGGTVIPSQTVQKGGMVTKPADPTREDFTFENWYSDVALTQVYDFAAAVNADITLYAKWTPKAGVMIYTVTFDTRGGTLIPPLAVAANGVATRPAADPTRENYLFENWYSDSTLTQVYDFALKVTKAITLYAKWTPTYTVTFDSGGGTAVATQTVLKDATVTKPVDPTRQDYVFENWYSDEALTQVYNFTSKVTQSITLYAKWKPFPTSFTIMTIGEINSLAPSTTLEFFIANVEPAGADDSVTWSVEGGAGNGTIDATGLYTSPDAIPNPAEITIKATGVTARTITATYSLTIANLFLIPDANFRAKLKTIVPNAFSGELLKTDHRDVTGLGEMVVNRSYIASLEGIQFFTGLLYLYCFGNSLTTLDLSKNKVLFRLQCHANQLTSLNVSENTNLNYLYCENNQLTGLDVSKLSRLRELYCENNQLTSLDLSGNTRLLYALLCDNNRLTTLDVSKNTALRILSCPANQLTALDVSKNIHLKTLKCGSNQLTALDVSQNPALIELGCNDNQLTALDVSQNTALTELNCSSTQLTALDVSKNTALKDLRCNDNSLTSLDISKNTVLEYLYCQKNQLTALDVSKSPNLTYFYCQDNQITSLDLSQNPRLIRFDCSNNSLTSLDIRGLREPSVLSGPFWTLNVGVNGKNLLTTLKVHDNAKQEGEIKKAKTNRGTNITIEVYTAAKFSAAYTQSCANYDPNANTGNGQCLSTN